MGCLEHQKPHYSNSLVYKPQVQSIIILRDESICAQAYSSSGFQKTPKDEKEPRTRNVFFTLCRAFKAQWRVASHPVTWYLCLQEVFINFSEQFRTAGRKKCNTVAPGCLLVNGFKIIIQKVYIYSVTEIIPVCSSTTPHAAAPFSQCFSMFGPTEADDCKILQKTPQQQQQQRWVDKTGEPDSGWPRDVETPAAGEGQAVSGTGAHRIRGQTPFRWKRRKCDQSTIRRLNKRAKTWKLNLQ